jgi:uncharacterized protein YdeI (YjbR/CyaY-like superfamily)
MFALNRKEYCRWIAEAKREETRQMRLGKSIEMLRNGVKNPRLDLALFKGVTI